MRWISTSMSLLLAAWAFGCAAHPVPARLIHQSEATIRDARDLNAASDPGAASQLAIAERELSMAKELVANRDNVRADQELRRCLGDAELAVSLAREAGEKDRHARARIETPTSIAATRE